MIPKVMKAQMKGVRGKALSGMSPSSPGYISILCCRFIASFVLPIRAARSGSTSFFLTFVPPPLRAPRIFPCRRRRPPWRQRFFSFCSPPSSLLPLFPSAKEFAGCSILTTLSPRPRFVFLSCSNRGCRRVARTHSSENESRFRRRQRGLLPLSRVRVTARCVCEQRCLSFSNLIILLSSAPVGFFPFVSLSSPFHQFILKPKRISQRRDVTSFQKI